MTETKFILLQTCIAHYPNGFITISFIDYANMFFFTIYVHIYRIQLNFYGQEYIIS